MMSKVKKLKTTLNLKILCMATKAEVEYDSNCVVIPSSEMSSQEKCLNWLENNKHI